MEQTMRHVREAPAAAQVTPEDEDQYYVDAAGWEANREAQIGRSERLAWRIAIAAAVLVVILVIALASLAPLKRVVTAVIMVDQGTKEVTVLNAADDRATFGYQELIDKHWAKEYVTRRENYFFRLLQADYDFVVAASDADVGRDYERIYDGTNARDKRLGSDTEVKVRVLSTTLAEDNVGRKAVVRFEKTQRRLSTGLTDPPEFFVATLSYAYRQSMVGSEEQLVRNPMGFRVTGYRTDAEAAPATARTN
ncbi:MAG TPA: VirB8/TrbF family protein, partial [Mycobacterium sp.]